MRIGQFIRTLVLCCAAAAAASMPAAAGTSFDFLFSVSHVGNDSQYFLNLAVGNAGIPRPVLEPVLPRLPMVERDLPVVLYLAVESGRPVDFIVSLRSQRLPWSVVFTRCGVPVERLYVGMDRDPGPPYGHAWGYWKKHRRTVRLADSEVVGLVNLQMGHRITGIPVCDLAGENAHGRVVTTVVADRKGRPWKRGGSDDAESSQGNQGKGHGHGNGNSHGNGHGQGKD